MKAGAAYRDITPDWPVHMQGYGSRNRKSEGVDDNLRVGCVALDSEGSRILILCYDMVGMRDTDAAIIKKVVSEETGTAPDSILISCSHTHFAPGVSTSVFLDPELGLIGPDSRHVRMVTDRSIAAAAAAIEDLKDGEIKNLPDTPSTSVLQQAGKKTRRKGRDSLFIPGKNRETRISGSR